MSTGNRIADYKYASKTEYDKKIKVNGGYVGVYSPKAMKKMYPKGKFRLIGETFDGSKRDRDRDIGRIELAEKRMYVTKAGTHSPFFRKKSSYIELQGGGYVAMLKVRLAAIILVAALLIGVIGGATLLTINGMSHSGESIDPNIKPIDVEYFVVSGSVSRGNNKIEDSIITLQGADMVTTTTTDSAGNYTFSYVKNGDYNVICTCGESVLTSKIQVASQAAKLDFTFPASETTVVKTSVDLYGKDTPTVIVGGLDTEILEIAQNDLTTSLSFEAAKLDEVDVPSDARSAIAGVSGELLLTYYDFKLLKTVVSGDNKTADYISTSNNVLEIVVPYDSTTAVGTYVLRYHGGSATRFTELTQMPVGDYQDGTYYVTPSKVYIYSSCYSVYAVGHASAGHVTKGSDTITYSNEASLTISTGEINMLYEHGFDSTHDSKVQLYLETEDGNLLISESGVVPPGNKIETMYLIQGITGLPTSGSYSAIMQIVYFGDGETIANTNINIPITLRINQ